MSLQIDVNCEPIPGYRLIERIGGGGFGEVWKAEAPGGLLKAIKIIHGDLRSIDVDGSRHAEQELRALKRLQCIRHPYLLSLERYDVVEGRVLIVTELADCNLWDRFREMRNQQRPGVARGELIRYLEEAAEVLDLMNTHYQLQHLDIKPQNLFLVYNHVKVADFGLVKDLEGMRGQITGGVTPVYAAPETFDSIITRYCDQYSLAICYQELLTGVRPFNGTSGQQLMLQHLREPPNLGPLPPADRAAVGRALSKKPEDRFPSCIQFVRALQSAGAETPAPLLLSASPSSSRFETPIGISRSASLLASLASGGESGPQQPMETPKTQLQIRRDESAAAAPVAYSMADMAFPPRIAPPVVTGEGCLVPAVLIGLGQGGLEVVREFRRSTIERFGMIDRLPHIKILYIDTDSEALHSATSSGTAALDPGEVIPARLNRPAHYLKPRRNGRSLIEGWFDPQTLYKIPRNPATVGLRSLGRLSFLDHYRIFAEKLLMSLDSCTHPDAISAADRATRLGMRTNRPRIYIIACLGGGTGSGMFIDAAYCAKHKLRQMGYTDPEIIGLFLLPAAERGVKGTGLANTYTALRELHHYSQPETTFTASYEERDGQIEDSSPPFTRCFVLPLPSTLKTGAGETYKDTARKATSFLMGDLLSPIGRAADEERAKASDSSSYELSVVSFNQASFIWPRQALLAKAARWLSSAVLQRWTASDPDIIGQYVKGWMTQRWHMEQLSPEQLVPQLQQAGEKILGQQAEQLFAAEAQPYVPKGWFARDADTTKLWQTLTKLQQLVGMPDERAIQRTVGQIEQKLEEAADAIGREMVPRITRLATTLLEHPDYRLVGAEVVVEQAQMLIDTALKQYESMAVSLGAQAIDAYFQIHAYLSSEKSQRKPTPSELAEAVRTYPTWRYQSLILRQTCRIYSTIKTALSDQLRELKFCRQRLEDITLRFQREQLDVLTPSDRVLLPKGVDSMDAGVLALQATITKDDIRAFDRKLQTQIEREFNALFNVCLSSVSMLGNLQQTIEDQAKTFLADRLAGAKLDQLFFARFTNPTVAGEALLNLHDQALPPVKLFGVERSETIIMGGPGGESSKQMKHLGEYAFPNGLSAYVPITDEVCVYREFTNIALTVLPQLGTMGEDAYNEALDTQGGSPHSRNDVATWQDVEVGV